MEKYILRMDKGRSNYYNYYTGLNWGDVRRYDMTIDSGTAGIDGAVELIAALVRMKEGAE